MRNIVVASVIILIILFFLRSVLMNSKSGEVQYAPTTVTFSEKAECLLTHNLGVVLPGTVHTLQIQLKKYTNFEHRIVETHSECACSIATMSQKTILPGSSIPVAIKFTAPQSKGEYSRSIKFVCNSKSDHYIYTAGIKCEIAPLIEVTPNHIVIPAIWDRKVDTNIKIKRNFDIDMANISCRVRTTKLGEEYLQSVIHRHAKQWANDSCVLVLSTEVMAIPVTRTVAYVDATVYGSDDQTEYTTSIPIIVEEQSSLRLVPKSLTFTHPGNSGIVNKTVILNRTSFSGRGRISATTFYTLAAISSKCVV